MLTVNKNDLEDLSLDTLVSFFDGNLLKNRFKIGEFKPYFESISRDISTIFEEEHPIQLEGNLLTFTLDFVGTADRVLSIEDKADIIKFIHFFCEYANIDCLVSYNDILLTYGGEDIC